MKLIIVGGPPSSGKTAVLIHTLNKLKQNYKVSVVKLDCLVDDDVKIYKDNGINAIAGLSIYICPDHYFATNIDRIISWGLKFDNDYLIIESAGLCNRCAPHLVDILSIAVIDMLSGINTPKKIGPLLKSADIAVLTKSDLISQAEREVFCLQIANLAPRVKILEINGVTGQRSNLLLYEFEHANEINEKRKYQALKLRYPMPGAVCSFCLGEKRVGEHFAAGNYKLIEFPDYELGDMKL